MVVGAVDLLQLLAEAAHVRNMDALRLNFAKTMCTLINAKAVQLMGLDVTSRRCVNLSCWPHSAINLPDFDLQGRGESEQLMLFALKSRHFQIERSDHHSPDVLLSTLKEAIFGSDCRENFAIIPVAQTAPATSFANKNDKSHGEEEPNLLPLVFFALLDGEPPDAITIKMARLYASYCHGLNQSLLDLNIRADEAENLSRSLARAESDQRKLREALPDLVSHHLVGSSQPMRQLRKNIARFAAADAPIFIHGETGTGKELAAREIHRLSARRNRAFIAINVTALPKGLEESELFGFVKGAFTGADNPRQGTFAAADGGTLFFDEIGDMSLDLQAKILRVLQEKSFRPLGSIKEVHSDFRLLSATHRNLEEMVEQGKFREDLFYRLTTFSLEMPPLRARMEDIGELCHYFLEQLAKQHQTPIKLLSAEARQELERLPLPGNVRQLHALLLRASYLSDGALTIEARHINEATKKTNKPIRKDLSRGLKDAVECYERDLLLAAYQQNGGQRSKMAQQLQIPLRTLADKMKKHQLERKLNEKDYKTVHAYPISMVDHHS